MQVKLDQECYFGQDRDHISCLGLKVISRSEDKNSRSSQGRLEFCVDLYVRVSVCVYWVVCVCVCVSVSGCVQLVICACAFACMRGVFTWRRILSGIWVGPSRPLTPDHLKDRKKNYWINRTKNYWKKNEILLNSRMKIEWKMSENWTKNYWEQNESLVKKTYWKQE